MYLNNECIQSTFPYPAVVVFPPKRCFILPWRPSFTTCPFRLKLARAQSLSVSCKLARPDHEQHFWEHEDINSASSASIQRLYKQRRGRQRKREGGDRVVQLKKQPRRTHKMLRVLGGSAQRRKLLSPEDLDVRPMMEVVKGATFSILQAAGGCPAFLRPGRWLDLYSGTGSVGIEAMSRGCTKAHFVEMDPWVVAEVLKPNLEATGFLDASTIHTIDVETFLARAEHRIGKEGKPFDYISVTPPYTAVNYDQLMHQLADSPVLGEETHVVIEYPLEVAVSQVLAKLMKIADRRFGRTNLVIYGPTWSQKR